MGRVKNSQNFNSINRNALTFDPDGISNITNNLIGQTPEEQDEILISGLETEQNATDKLAFAWKLISELACKLVALIAEKTYEVVCHVNDMQPVTAFTVPTGVPTPIPFYSVLYSPADGSYLAGNFTAGKTGFYDVDCLYYDTIVAPVTRVWIGISGYNSDITGGSAIINTDFFELQASRKVFCRQGENISAYLFHNFGADIVFNNYALDEHGDGYISIHYCGSTKAATIL